VLDRMMSVAEDRPALTSLGAARSTLRAALSETGLRASQPLCEVGHRDSLVARVE